MNTNSKLLFLLVVNTMIGSGMFINLANLSAMGGCASGLVYLLGWIIFLPIIYCMGSLAQYKSLAGGIFQHTRDNLSDLAGCVTSWAYFLSKGASVGVICHTVITTLLPQSAMQVPGLIFVYDLLLLLAIFAISCTGVTIVGNLQKFFAVIKIIPLIFLIVAGFGCLSWNNWQPEHLFYFQSNFFALLPIGLFALAGFEVIFNVGHQLGSTVGLRAMLVKATLFVALIYFVFHSLAFLSVGESICNASKPLNLFLAKMTFLPGFMQLFFSYLVLISMLIAAYGIFVSNSWNLFALAKSGQLPGSSWLTQLPQANAPVYCFLLHSVVSMGFLAICRNIVLLQTASVFAASISYLLCMIGAVCWARKIDPKVTPIAILAVVSCLLISAISFKNVVRHGICVEFLVLFICGIVSMIVKRQYGLAKKV